MRQSNMFDEFMTSKVRILKPDGRRWEDVPASVQSKAIFIHDVSIPLEVGDIVERDLPSRVVEQFEITDPGYHEAFQSIPAMYQAKFRLVKEVSPRSGQPTMNVTYNLHGPNSRVNIAASDNSINIQATQETLFSDMRDFVRTQLPQTEQSTVLALIDEMDASANTSAFRESYLQFVSVAADHLGVLTPFLPLLANLLSR